MPAAAAKARIKAPVGDAPRPESSDGAKVKNAPADVLVVQRLLGAAGHNMDANGRVSGGFVKAIRAFQKAHGFKYPDGVIDPGGRTFKTLVKTASGKKKKGPDVEIEVYQIVVRGQRHVLSEKDFNKAVGEVCKKLNRVLIGMKSQHDTIDSTANFYIDAATGASGFMDALVMWTSSLRAGLQPPGFSHGGSARVMLMRLEKAISSKDVRKAVAAMPAAQKELNAYAKEVKVYGDQFAGGAKDMQENLELVRDTSFEIAGYIATALIMARGTATPTQAKASSGAIFGFIKSASTQYGRSVAGYSDSAAQSAAIIMFDTLAGGVKGGLSAKYVDNLGGALADKLVGKPPFNTMGKSVLKKFFRNWAHGAGKQTVTEIFESVLAIVTDIGKTVAVKGKKYDWQKEFKKKLVDAAYKVVTAGVMKNVEGANKKLGAALTKNARDAAKNPAFLKKLRLDKNDWYKALPIAKQYEHMVKVVESVSNNVANDALKSSWGKLMDSMSGTESAQVLADRVARDLIQHKSFLKATEKQFGELKKKAGKKK